MTDRVAIASIVRMGIGPARTDQDLVAAEAPLLIDVQHSSGAPLRLGLLMRTPGDDDDLVRGLLVTEGVITTSADLLSLEHRQDADGTTLAIATIAADRPLPSTSSALNPTSACGLCSRVEFRAVARGARPPDTPRFDAAVLARMPATLRNGQTVFAETGGLHAAALVTADGRALYVREDVGRHNAVDKVVGAACAAGRLPATADVLAVSGRVAYEIVLKATMAGVAAVLAVGAPSSLAVEAARAAQLTLVGFARDGRFNVYTGHERVQ